MLQVSDKQYESYRLLVDGVSCLFIPMALFLENDFRPLKPQVHKTKGYLFWNVKGKQVSYTMIKKAIKSWRATASV